MLDITICFLCRQGCCSCRAARQCTPAMSGLSVCGYPGSRRLASPERARPLLEPGASDDRGVEARRRPWLALGDMVQPQPMPPSATDRRWRGRRHSAAAGALVRWPARSADLAVCETLGQLAVTADDGHAARCRPAASRADRIVESAGIGVD